MVVTVRRDNEVVVLDEAPTGVLSEARVEGETLLWRHGNDQRSAPAS
ncbi:MAG: hypothetical protein LC777_09830 [Actinobacteria bacterium]|nr:hypothetical protein [Actinomycetota bacterium]